MSKVVEIIAFLLSTVALVRAIIISTVLGIMPFVLPVTLLLIPGIVFFGIALSLTFLTRIGVISSRSYTRISLIGLALGIFLFLPFQLFIDFPLFIDSWLDELDFKVITFVTLGVYTDVLGIFYAIALVRNFKRRA